MTTIAMTNPPSMPIESTGAMVGLGFGAVTPAIVQNQPTDGGDQQHDEQADGLQDGVLDRHAAGVDGVRRRCGERALELSLSGEIRAGVRRGRVLGRRAQVRGLRAARVGLDGARVLERRVVECGV